MSKNISVVIASIYPEKVNEILNKIKNGQLHPMKLFFVSH